MSDPLDELGRTAGRDLMPPTYESLLSTARRRRVTLCGSALYVSDSTDWLQFHTVGAGDRCRPVGWRWRQRTPVEPPRCG